MCPYNNNEPNRAGTKLSKGEQTIYDAFRGNGEFKREDIEELLQVSQPIAIKHLKSILEKNIVTKTGKGENTVYSIKNN